MDSSVSGSGSGSNRIDIFEIYRRYCDIVSGNGYACREQGCRPNDKLQGVKYSSEALAQLLKLVELRAQTSQAKRFAPLVPALGTRSLNFDDLFELMSRLNLMVDSCEFTCFYEFVFFMYRENGQKNITVSRAIVAWRLVLAGRYAGLQERSDEAGPRRRDMDEGEEGQYQELAASFSQTVAIQKPQKVVEINEDLLEECSKNCRFSILGEFVTDRKLNGLVATRTTVKAWKTKVLYQQPWSSDGLVMCWWSPEMEVATIKLHMVPIWVQLHDLPPNLLTYKIIHRLVSEVGDVDEVDLQKGGYHQRSYVRSRVLIDISKPLQGWLPVHRKPTNKVDIVELKYERLPIFSYHCGVIGYADRNWLKKVLGELRMKPPNEVDRARSQQWRWLEDDNSLSMTRDKEDLVLSERLRRDRFRKQTPDSPRSLITRTNAKTPSGSGAWPVLIDDFVEHMYRITGSNSCSTGSFDCSCSVPEAQLWMSNSCLPGLKIFSGSKRKSLVDSGGDEVVSPNSLVPDSASPKKRNRPVGSLNDSPCALKESFLKPLVIEARANTRQESAKIRNRRLQKKFNGSSVRPRLSVFCSAKQLYAMLVDDQNKKCLFYGSTLQNSIRENPSFSTIEAAQRVGEELVKACIDLKIHEISSYDRNGFARGERMQAFEIAIFRHGFLPR
ncbi:hypothetical protein HHK36_015351 [Tetracentron sinense]|uniref:DUF4283 domain-containing protein n=1 Tax=Tetracentron sinense TaxID=13715 RepID=A0A834Z2W9_TETSI|nr:hypothetical protein HHK36_015351 [Tetracentron sinense]